MVTARERYALSLNGNIDETNETRQDCVPFLLSMGLICVVEDRGLDVRLTSQSGCFLRSLKRVEGEVGIFRTQAFRTANYIVAFTAKLPVFSDIQVGFVSLECTLLTNVKLSALSRIRIFLG